MAVLEQGKIPLLWALIKRTEHSINLKEVQRTSLDVAGGKLLIAGVQVTCFHRWL